MSTSATSRARQSRKRANDDASYAAPSGTASALKRSANIDGDAPRAKRKRMAAPPPPMPVSTGGGGGAFTGFSGFNFNSNDDDEDRVDSVVDFAAMPMTQLTRYLVEFDLAPSILPSPLTAYDPPSPCSLVCDSPSRSVSPLDGLCTPAIFPTVLPTDVPVTPPARHRRGSTATRSSMSSPRIRTPILADVGDVRAALAGIARRHFEGKPTDELDTLSSFMATVRRRGV